MTAIGTVFLDESKTDLPILENLHLVGARLSALLALVPIPSILVAILFRAFSSPRDRSTPVPPPVARDDPPAASQDGTTTEGKTDAGGSGGGGSKDGRGGARVKKTDEDRARYAEDEPETGFGPSPANVGQLVENVLVIAVPAILLTLGHAVRYLQDFETFWATGEPTPWVSAFSRVSSPSFRF